MGYLSEAETLEAAGITEDEAISAASAIAKAEKAKDSATAKTQRSKDADRAIFAKAARESGGDAAQGLFVFCFRRNVYYDGALAKKLAGSTDDAIRNALPEPYLEAIAADEKYKGKTFLSQLDKDVFERMCAEKAAATTKKPESALSSDDKKHRQQILSIVNYDPFENEPAEDKPQMYRDLAGLLTDAMRRDIPKRNAAIEMVHNYATISRYQKKKTAFELLNDDSDEIQEKIDKCSLMISKMQDTINKLSKENGFSAGRNVGGSNGRGGLSDVMSLCEERGYDKESANLYDIKTSEAIEQVANISFKAMLNQVNFSNTDYADILAEQCKVVRECRSGIAKAQEMARLACEKLEKQELLNEYRKELEKKGIKEEDLEELVNREITMYGEDK